MYSNDTWVEGLLRQAHKYYSQHDEHRLQELLAEAWSNVEGNGLPVRSDQSPGVRIANRLKKSLVTEPEITSATVILIASKVLEHLQASGYDLSDYQVPIAILIAYLVRAVLSEWHDAGSTQ